MAKLIQFHVPDGFRTRAVEDPAEPRGKVIEFRPRSADAEDVNGSDRPWGRVLQNMLSAAIDPAR